MDPLEFRLKNLKDDRLRAVLEAAAKTFGWGKSKPAANHGFGIAGGFEKRGYIANCAEVDSKGYMDRTPLSWAAGNGHEAVVRLLLVQGADPAAKPMIAATKRLLTSNF